jgi:hypothetical protein
MAEALLIPFSYPRASNIDRFGKEFSQTSRRVELVPT